MSDFGFLNTHRTWEDWCGMLLGALIAGSPWFPIQDQSGIAGHQTMVFNTVAVGLVVFGLSQLEYVALQRWQEVTTIVVDKTGTLTEGRPRLVTVEPQPGVDAATLLRLVGSLEHVSEHPLAGAIVAGARERGAALTDVRDFQSVTGKGVRGTVAGRRAALGNKALLDDLGVPGAELGDKAESLRRVFARDPADRLRQPSAHRRIQKFH